MNKKTAAIILAVLVLAGLCACGTGAGSPPDSGIPQTTASAAEPEPVVTGTLYKAVYAGSDGKTITADELEAGDISLELLSSGVCTLELGSGKSNGLWTADGERLSLNFEGSSLQGTIGAGIVRLALEMPGYPAAELTLAEPWLIGELLSDLEQENIAPEPENAAPFDPVKWWSGSWYGWWSMYRQSGAYTGLESDWWDICAEIRFDGQGSMTMLLWDSDGSYDNPAGAVTFGVNRNSGTAVSKNGRFFGQYIGDSAWIISPAQSGYEDTIIIEPGDVKDDHGSYRYRMVLRRWGSTWDELENDPMGTVRYFEVYPAHYSDWYLPLIRQGAAMPDRIGSPAA